MGVQSDSGGCKGQLPILESCIAHLFRKSVRTDCGRNHYRWGYRCGLDTRKRSLQISENNPT